MPDLPSETCDGCGRTVAERPTGERDGKSDRWCSAACRRSGRALEEAVLALLDARATGATICPSEAARAVGGGEWRPLMEPARAAARRLVERGDVEITQRGAVVDPSTARGPVRVRRVRRRPDPDRT